MNLHSMFFIFLIISGSILGNSIVPKIGIIGGGISGATTAASLRGLFGTPITIDLYESKNIGGRMSLIELGGHKYEAGGPGIQSSHRYMSRLLQLSGLDYTEYPRGRYGFYDGKNYVFKGSHSSFRTFWDFICRYGYIDYWRWSDLISIWKMKFFQIYVNLDQHIAFSTVEKLLSSMDTLFVKLTQTSAYLALKYFGFSDTFIQEFGLAVTRACYLQSTRINGFVGVNAFNTFRHKTWAVSGGIHQLVEFLISKSESRIKRKHVTDITWLNGSFTITAQDIGSKKNENIEINTYDIIVIACPLTKNLAAIKFQKFSKKLPEITGEYQKAVTTFVQGILNFKSIGFSNYKEILEEIVSINPNTPFYSLSRAYPVTYNESNEKKLPIVWKILSQEPLSKETMNFLFINRKAVKAVKWLAYPQYSPPEKLGKFELYPNLYYTSAIEWADSNMEMNVIASRNVALLIYNQWMKIDERIDPSVDKIIRNY